VLADTRARVTTSWPVRLDEDQNSGHGLGMSSHDALHNGANADLGQTALGSSSGDTGGDALPAPGELHIKQKRTWKTWQLMTGMVLAALVGMFLNYGSGGASSSSSSAPAYVLPKSSGSPTTTAPPSTRGSSRSTSTTTTAAGGSTTTTTAAGAAGTTSPAAATGSARVLMGPTQLTGNWTSPAFTTTVAGWNIGWAFRCVPAPAGGPSFQVFVTPAGSSPTGTPAISQTGASGQSVTSQSSLGSQTLVVEAPATCTWAVKVTGS